MVLLANLACISVWFNNLIAAQCVGAGFVGSNFCIIIILVYNEKLHTIYQQLIIQHFLYIYICLSHHHDYENDEPKQIYRTMICLRIFAIDYEFESSGFENTLTN